MLHIGNKQYIIQTVDEMRTMFTICSQENNTDNTINIIYTIYTDNTKRGRTCGSGKKYKNCCGKNA